MKIVIAGYGVEGRSNYAYFRRAYPQATVVIADQQPVADAPADAIIQTGEAVFTQLQDADMVVRTASLSPRHITTQGRIWSATNEFFAHCPAPIIGVTGTKGKGTTSSFIASILRAAGKTVHLIGNIGVPALDVLEQVRPDDIVVYELSSFQLWDLKKSPQVAVVLMIEADHLDVHQDMDDYVTAKAHITAHQTVDDTVVYYRDNQLSRQIAEASAAQRVAYPQPLTEAMQRAIVLPGAHNQDNASAAILAVRAVLSTIDEATICRGLAAFTGLPHRLKFVREVNDVKFYDDSISTTPGSLLAALRSFTAPKVLIIGGRDKGADYQPMMSALASDSSVRAVVLVGSSAAMFTEKLMAAGIAQEKLASMGMVSMAEAVAQAAAMAHPGDVVILSPAAASFDQYKSYVDRGQQFVAAVNQL